MKFLASSLLALCFVVAPVLGVDNAPKPGEKPVPAEQLEAQLKQKILPKVQFANMTLAECAALLKKQGIPVEVGPGVKEEAKVKITLTLNNVPAIEVIKYVTNLSNTSYAVVDGKVLINPLPAPGK